MDLAARRKAWIAQGQSFQSLGVEGLLKIQERVEAGTHVLTVRETIMFIEAGVKLELLAMGRPQEIHGHTGSDGGPIKLDWDSLIAGVDPTHDPVAERLQSVGRRSAG